MTALTDYSQRVLGVKMCYGNRMKKPVRSPKVVARSSRSEQKSITRARVVKAAWELFSTVGYDETTTKAVATKAGVAAGTVFVHARDKEDLLCLVMHDKLEEVVDAQFASLPAEGPLLDRLLHVFRGFFDMYGEHPKIAVAFIKANVGGANGPAGQRVNALTFAFLHRLGTIVGHAQTTGEVARDVDLTIAAQNLFGLYTASLMIWLSGHTSREVAVELVLRQSIALQIRGLAAR